MSVDVIMPQMGESIAEGTITKWLKQIGEKVERDEPLFEISTDKVDAEIPSPAAGVLLEILVPEGETVPINTVVARIGAKEEALVEKAPEEPQKKAEKIPSPGTAVEAEAPSPRSGEVAATERVALKPGRDMEEAGRPADRITAEELRAERRRVKSSPLVRKIAKEHNIDLSLVKGTGTGGRVTKKDILAHIESPPAPAPKKPEILEKELPVKPPRPKEIVSGEEREIREPMNIMRKKIAEHMTRSRRTSAHVSTVFEVDMSRVVARREALKEAYLKEGVKLSFLPFVIEAVVKGLKEFPIMNSSVDGDTIVYKRYINIGVAVALDWGLIVPVIKNADNMSLLGLARAVNDLAERARTKKLHPEEVHDGTFTITNPGVFGSLMGMPIINQPQVAIMDVGAIVKRPVVIDDAIAIRPMAFLTLSFDHRVIDGAVADQFLAFVKSELEEQSAT